MEIKIPKEIYDIHKIFQQKGYQLFLVGGALRNILLGYEPGDYDLATDALPEAVQGMFRRVIPTGLAHGTVTLCWKKLKFEITTFRRDGVYRDNRHPEQVTFSTELAEDIQRRDFTINAIAYSMSDNTLIDLCTGQQDLRKGIIRCIGRAETRFREDALRMLRAIRFAARFNFSIEPKTFHAIQKLHQLIQNIATERVQDEFMKIFRSKYCMEGITLLEKSMLLSSYISPIQNMDAVIHINEIDPKYVESRIALYFYSCNVKADVVQRELKKLLTPKKQLEKICKLFSAMGEIQYIDSDAKMRQLLAGLGKNNLSYLIPLLKILSSDEKIIQQAYEAKQDALSIKELEIDGRLLMKALQIDGGPILGELLQYALQTVLEDPQKNTSGHLIAACRAQYNILSQGKTSK